MKTVHFDHGSQLWFIRETDRENNRERETACGWDNCVDAEDSLYVSNLKFGNWQPIQKHGVWA